MSSLRRSDLRTAPPDTRETRAPGIRRLEASNVSALPSLLALEALELGFELPLEPRLLARRDEARAGVGDGGASGNVSGALCGRGEFSGVGPEARARQE